MTAADHDPETLATRVARAARRPDSIRTLLLDLDGTLAPIAPTPEAASVPDATLDAIRRLVGHRWRVAIVSGRPASQARLMVPVRNVRIFGSHGLEGSWGEGRAPTLDPALKRRLARLARGAGSLVSSTPGAQMERKPTGIAFHDRNVPADRLKDWRATLRNWLRSQDLTGLETLPGRRVLELRPEGIHKGLVARDPLDRLGRRPADESLVAIGDDRTDEDLFREIGRRGLTVRVGRPGVATVATLRLPSPRSVQQFLRHLANHSP